MSGEAPTSPLRGGSWFREARSVYPGVALSEESFVAHLADRSTGVDPGRLEVAHLYLARACADRDAVAVAHFDRETTPEIEAALKRFPKIGVSVDDVRQRLWERFFLAEPPAILGYAGTGSLRGWVRAAAVNLLLNMTERETREVPTDNALFEAMIGTDVGLDVVYAKNVSRRSLEISLAAAMKTLDVQERNLLRHAYVDGHSVDAIGAIYGVHRATAARRVERARELLVTRTLADLMQRYGVSQRDARSIVAAGLSGVGSMLRQNLG